MRALVIGLTMAVACGGGDGISISTNQDNVCSTIAEVGCHNLYQCCTESEVESYLGVSDPRTEAQCRDDLTKRCERSMVKLADSIQNHRASFDGKVMDTCLNAVLAPTGVCASVDAMLPWIDACADSAWTGKVADGSMCYSRYECASTDSYCAANQTCTPLPTENMGCSQRPGCASGLYCDGSSCRRLGMAGASCITTSQCAKDLFCDPSRAICAPLRNTGEACTGDDACKSRDCLPGMCSTVPLACYSDSQCYGVCQSGRFCHTDSECGDGTCSNSPSTLCSNDFNCQGLGSGSTNGTCVFADHCTPGTCQGEVVCGEAQFVADYCVSALGALPVPPTN